jgi:copper chaperone
MCMKLHVEGMTCQHCVASVARAIHAIDPAARVEVDLASGQVAIDGNVPAERALAAIGEEGYRATLAPCPERGGSSCCGGCGG